MPHYKDGTEAHIGDIVTGKDWSGETVIAHVVHITPSAQSCNMTVSRVVYRPVVESYTYNVHDFELLTRPD